MSVTIEDIDIGCGEEIRKIEETKPMCLLCSDEIAQAIADIQKSIKDKIEECEREERMKDMEKREHDEEDKDGEEDEDRDEAGETNTAIGNVERQEEKEVPESSRWSRFLAAVGLKKGVTHTPVKNFKAPSSKSSRFKRSFLRLIACGRIERD